MSFTLRKAADPGYELPAKNVLSGRIRNTAQKEKVESVMAQKIIFSN